MGEFLGGGFHDDVIFEMGSSISWQIKAIKSLSAKTRHRSEVRQQPTLHAMDKCVCHIVTACLLVGFSQGMSYVRSCTY